MKKFIALVLTLALAVSLCACSSKAGNQTVTFTVPMDDSTYTFTAPVDENGESATLPGGATIALATEQASLDDGADTLLWKGIQTFASSLRLHGREPHCRAIPRWRRPKPPCAKPPRAARRWSSAAARRMAQALFNIQNNYPGVHYLLFDGEPHNEQLHQLYHRQSNVHCVLFQEEQAGYLAGYAAVTDGYTQLGFIGAEEIPGIVRYVTGFLQGAEYAAEQQGLNGQPAHLVRRYLSAPATTPPTACWTGATTAPRCSSSAAATWSPARSTPPRRPPAATSVRVMASDYDQTDSSDRDPGQRHQVL